MALRWRIRHKLMLGLVLVVGIMALLLGGTLNGLWSYYVTTSIIRSKLVELRAAEDLKEAIAELIGPQIQADLCKSSPAEFDRHEKVLNVQLALEEYERHLQDNPGPHGNPNEGSHERGLLGDLRQNMKSFKDAVEAEANRWIVDGGRKAPEVEPEGSEGLSPYLVTGLFCDLAMPGVARQFKLAAYQTSVWKQNPVQRAVHDVKKNSKDLCQVIYGQLNDHLNESRRHYQVSLWIVVPSSVVGLLLMAGMMRSFYAWILSPIRVVEAGVNRVAQGDFDHRIEVHSGDEMEDLADAFNDMMKRLCDLYSDLARQVNERSRQLVRSERLASVGFLAAGVAHEINNPLASIAFCSEALEARLDDLLRQVPTMARGGDEREVFAKYLKMIQEEAFRCKSITERLLAFSRTGERRREMTDLGQLVQSVLDITQHLQNFRGKQIAFEKIPERGSNGRIQAPVNGEEIKSVVLNLVVNALDSMEDGGKLTIQLLQKDGQAEMHFIDTGCGMTQEVLENIFEPFFTRSRTGKGTGLGLTISHRIINQHGGEIEAMSAGPNQGSTFTVRLPLQVEETPAVPAGETVRLPEQLNQPASRIPKGKAA